MSVLLTPTESWKFVDPANTATVRLNLNVQAHGDWAVARGASLGEEPLESNYIAQPPFDGVVLTSSWRTKSVITLPLILLPPAPGTSLATATANMKTKFEALATELDRKNNAIAWTPNGFASAYVADTFRANIPSLRAGGLQAPSPFVLLQTGVPILVLIERQPGLRGAGTRI